MGSRSEANTVLPAARASAPDPAAHAAQRSARGPSRGRAAMRLFLFLWITLQELVRCMVLLGGRPPSRTASQQALQRWCARLVRAMGVRVRFVGAPPPPGVLLVSNHRSYMDIAVIGAATACSFLAKSEVAHWPLVGTGARRFANIVFVRRDSASSRKEARGAVASVLRSGGTITVFPEGTTDAGPGLLPFRKGIFQVAARERFTVVPLAIAYHDPRDAWVGRETFLGHFLRAFSKRETHVTLAFGEPLGPGDAEALRLRAWEWIREALGAPASGQDRTERRAA